eukprot:TRINITY_DN65935_c3_g1_i1.p2 TRINITY_DN65935_c3_g1~~TRINITY_DN65935_c3_g1_i1.p2  ORF type:complete len:174 (-),score=89.36 TRINITY_DN65935_c3_g1_i1:230-751(-)
MPTQSYEDQPVYDDNFQAAEEEWNPSSPKSILRYVELFCVMLSFAVMASVKKYDNLAQAENMVMIAVFAFIYVIFALVADAGRFQSRFIPNWDLFEFVFDFMFTTLLFFGAMSLAIKCNKDAPGTSKATCSVVYSPSNAESKTHTSSAFGFLASFAFVVSTMFAYRRVVESRA